ncbi:hypothetical protein ACFQX6_16590 [Streptosporangium lutulentum]
MQARADALRGHLPRTHAGRGRARLNRCARSAGSSRSATARASSTASDGVMFRPCSRRV